jgi:NADH-quinone oxidoreductase subunit H
VVAVQARHFHVTGLGWLPKWNIFLQLPAFLIYMIAALAETNRPPFDLPEAETELVAGYHTEYSGIKFAMFFLAEYMHAITVSAVGVTLFLGGWHGPQFHVVRWLWPLLWFLVKLFVVLFCLIWIRATVPRFRYDRLMNFGWKFRIPAGLLWIVITAAAVELPNVYPDWRAALIIASGTVVVIVLLLPLFVGPRQGAAGGQPASKARAR